VAAGQTRGRDLRRATEALSLVHATTIGVVLNEVTKATGYGYGYGKRYGYGEYAPTGVAANGDGKYASTGAAANGDGAQPIGAGPVLPRHRRTTQPRTGDA
jgi:Mrp family chromosome partitioning ATPase